MGTIYFLSVSGYGFHFHFIWRWGKARKRGFAMGLVGVFLDVF